MPALAWEVPPGAGEALSASIQLSVLAATLPACTGRYAQMIHDGARNATLVRRAGAGYDQVAAGAQPFGGGSGSNDNDLGVEAADVTDLARRQQEVVTGIGQSQQITDGATAHVTTTHGLACAATAAAVGFAQTSRAAAATAVQGVSTALSEKLQTAATHYSSADHQESGNLGNQMHTR